MIQHAVLAEQERAGLLEAIFSLEDEIDDLLDVIDRLKAGYQMSEDVFQRMLDRNNIN